MKNLKSLLAGVVVIAAAACMAAGAAKADDTYLGAWKWSAAALKKNKNANANASILVMKKGVKMRYCYMLSCSDVKATQTPDGGFYFSTNGKNYFEMMPQGNAKVTGRFWFDFAPPARPPDAQIVMTLQ